MNEENLWGTIISELDNSNCAVLIVIIQRIGSAPNVPGAKMLVMLDNVMGTVGGGISEHKLFDRARDMLSKEKLTIETIHLDHNENATENRSGMICSGSQKFALIPLGKEHLQIIKEIKESHINAIPGVLTLDEKNIHFKIGITLKEDRIYSEEGTSWTYKENIGVQDKLFIIGGGHVSLALSRIMKTLNFHVTVIDDRNKLPTMITNTYANEKIIASYDTIEEIIPEGNNVFVAIMTFGHISDEQVLEKIITKKCKYIGMMASSRKKQQILSNLEKKGITKSLLDTIYSPIGIKINSNTPEEIAISIAAELIQTKN
ncbi:MAG: XdhC family protein [Candidatus Heimdallarchaeota archaeon]|nr:XdhC family protein [Candidatus Heimdallarchaeota archaeon]MCK4770034.1 XdhC family protein [Candidatus Heimdallarchaeota archaeon]